MKKILVICVGNKYRSPLCAAVLAREPSFEIRSAGFRESGNRAAKGVREFAATKGLDLEGHRSTQITSEMIQWADHIVYMNEAQRHRAGKMHQRNFRTWINLGWSLKPVRHRIPDPAFIKVNSPRFEEVMVMIYIASVRLTEYIKSI